MAPCLHRPSHQARRAAAGGRDGTSHCECTPARVETLRRRSQGGGMINTAYIERLNATFREHLAPLARRCRALARHPLTLHEGMFLVGTVYNFCTPHESLDHARKMTPAMAAGIHAHCWTLQAMHTIQVPRA